MARSTGQRTVDNQETTWCFDCGLSIAGSGLVDRKPDRLCRVVDKSIVILLTEDRNPLFISMSLSGFKGPIAIGRLGALYTKYFLVSCSIIKQFIKIMLRLIVQI